MTVQAPVGGGASETTEPAAGSSAATDVSLLQYVSLNWRWQARFDRERDRRYTERDALRSEALRIKETGDEKALALARDIQTYKDVQENDIRNQITTERGDYARRTDLVAAIEKIEERIKPIDAYVAGQQGGPRALTTQGVVTIVGVFATLLTIVVIGANWLASSNEASPPSSPTVVCTATYHPDPCP